MEEPTVSVVIPAYNEAENIGEIVSRLRDRYPGYEIVVVDDGSTDGTSEIASSSGAVVYRHPYNIGNGAAVKSGIRVATGDILVFMDGDGQHQPEDIGRLLENIALVSLLGTMMVLGVAQIVLREIFDSSITWSDG